MAEWLCSLVGPEGLVVATDLETKFVSAIDAPNLEVREHCRRRGRRSVRMSVEAVERDRH